MTKGRVTVKEYAAFAYEVYFESQQEVERELPSDWTLFETCPEPLRLYGYFGSSFIRVAQDKKTVDLIIAHRGTDNLSGAIEDTQLWLTNHVPAQFQYGVKPFVQHVIAAMEKQYPPNEYQVNWFVTGHSLGGTLAELTIADNELSGMTGLSFESPGSVTLIEQMQTENFLPPGALNYVKSIDKSNNPVAISIKTRPDEINTLQPTPNPPLGPVPVPNIYPPNLFNVLPIDPGYVDYTSYSFYVEHPMKNILEWINTNDISTLPVMLEAWPMGFFAGYRWYKSYDNNKAYWDGYIDELWNNDGILSSLIQTAFRSSFETFKAYYIDYFLYKACESSEQKTRAQNFLEFITEHHINELGCNQMEAESLRAINLSGLQQYMPDAQEENPVAVTLASKAPYTNLVTQEGFFKQRQTNTSAANTIEYGHTF